MSRRGLLTLITTLLVAAAGATAGASEPGAASSCARYAAPGGSDSAAGTASAPLRSAARLVASLSPGETGCLRSGVYASNDEIKISTPGIMLTSAPGERGRIVGRIWVAKGADGVTVEELDLDGRNSRDLPSPTVNAHDTVWRGNSVTNGHAGVSCFNLGHNTWGHADRTLIEGNRIHDCGRLPATNQDHGIYAARTVGTVIKDNWIYSNADRGVQLYPNADRTVVTGNVIDGNGQGVIFGGDSSSASDHNVVEGNVITSSTIRWNVEDHWPGPRGTGNVARRNCVWTSRGSYRGAPDGSGIEPEASGFAATGNVVAKPGFVDPLKRDLTLTAGSRCAEMLAGSAPVPDGPPATAPPAAPGATSPPTPKYPKGSPKVRLRTAPSSVGSGRKVTLRGVVRARRAGRLKGKRARIEIWRDGAWRRFAARRVPGRRFTIRRRVAAAAAGPVHFRAQVRPFGRSRPVRIKVLR